MDAHDLPALNLCVNQLMTTLAEKEDELWRREQCCGEDGDTPEMTRLREEVASLERRLTLAEKLQDEALKAKE